MHARVRLGHSPIEVVPLGVGCWAWGDQRFWRFGQDHGPQDVVGAFAACVEAGLDLYDTAEVYGSGKSEQMLGALVRRSPRPLVVATKYAPLSRPRRAGGDSIGAGEEPETARPAARRSLSDSLGRS